MIDSRSRVEDILNVILGNLDPSVLQPPQSRVESLLQRLNEMISDFDGKIPVHICTYDEYDHETLMPTIEDPEENAFYLVPAGESGDDMYIEWIFTESNRWERFGSGGGTVTIEQSDWNQNDSSQADFIKNKPDLTLKLDKNQGAANSGKFMGINSSGNVVPLEVEGGNIAVTEELVSGEDYELTVEEGETGSVISVAGKTGTVTLDGNDVTFNDSVTYNDGTIGGTVADLKSHLTELNAVEYSERTEVLGYSDVNWDNATDGRLQSNGSVSGSTGYCVSDYISLENVKKIFRHNVSTKYNLEAYALYDSSKNMIAGTYHARTTNYDFTTYLSYTNVVFYDISAQGASYIRITKDKSYSFLFTEESVSGYNYTIDGKVEANNIATLEEQAISFETVKKAFNDKMLEAKAFIKYRTDRDITFSNTYINYNNGNILTGSAYSSYRTSDYIEVEAQKQYASGNGYSYVCYDANKALLPNAYGRLFSSDSSLRGTGRYWFITTPENCKYIRICDAENTSGVVCGLQKVPGEYDIVNLGDSIFGVNPACFDISSIAQEKTGFNFANCGFGGSQASTYPDSTSPYYSFNLWKLADAIYDEDFTEQDASAEAIQATDGSILYVPRLTILKSVDFTKIRLLTIAYGTNDASKNTVLDNENDKYDKTTFCGALRYSIEKIYSKYPKINIALMSPPYGRKGTNNETSTDAWTNSLGLHLMDYVDAMKDVAEEYHLPFFNHYLGMGVNDYNWQTYLRDGTHLSYINGANLFGAKVGQEVNGLLAEYS